MSYRYKTDGFAHLEEHHTDMKQCEAVQFPHGWELCSESMVNLEGVNQCHSSHSSQHQKGHKIAVIFSIVSTLYTTNQLTTLSKESTNNEIYPIIKS